MNLKKHARKASKRSRPAAALLGLALSGPIVSGRVVSSPVLSSVCLVVAAPLQSAAAQTGQADPPLHKRVPGQTESAASPLKATGHLSLPPEAEGDYPWDKQGSVIDLFFEDSKLHGYLTDHLDPDPHVAPAVYDFATSHADGHFVEWTTRIVHGTWYSFTGHLERGLAETTAQPGYYLLTGTLTVHDGADSTPRTVSLKREPGD